MTVKYRAIHVSAQLVNDMEEVLLDTEEYEEMTDKQKFCYIQCGRLVKEDCEQDYGLVCGHYNEAFSSMVPDSKLSDFELDAWEPIKKDEHNDEKSKDEDGACEMEIEIKKPPESNH